MAERCYAECDIRALYVECCYAESRYAECHYDECRFAECHYGECRYTECRGAFYLTISRRKGAQGTNTLAYWAHKFQKNNVF